MPKKSKFPPKRSDNSYIVKFTPKLEWSQWQKAIFRNVNKETGHLVVEAYAGSSKTTSIVESFKYVPKGKKILALAFNKIIQEELQSRSPSYAECLTFHSLGLRAIKHRFGKGIIIDDYKCSNIVKTILGDDIEYDLIDNFCKTVAFCKYGLLDTPNDIEYLIDRFGIDLCGYEKDKFAKIVCQILKICKADTTTIDFNDMCWFPFVYNLPLGNYHYVYVDEVQDLNKAQLVMAKKACDPFTGRIVAVGDPNQALYGWRMADTSVLEDIKKKESTKILTLPISYRCPKSIIDLAKQWVPDIACPETAILGEVIDISLNELYSQAKPGSFILSRTNAPLIKICMTFIKRGIKANIRGRDIGDQLAYLIKKSKKKTIQSFLKWLETWKTDEVERLQKKNINPENIVDKYECLSNLCEECSSLDEVVTRIDELFNDTDEKNIIWLSTVHRSKGLETDEVFILRWTFKVWFDQDMSLLEKPFEEGNIAYVAATRVKKKLILVRKVGKQHLKSIPNSINSMIDPNTGAIYNACPQFMCTGCQDCFEGILNPLELSYYDN